MKLQVNELENGIRLISLEGKLDSAGVYNVEVDFTRYCLEEKRNILVDLSKVSYISSIGIPMLVNTAKTLASKGRRMALLKPQKNVSDVLDLVGVSNIIPIYYDLKMAKQAF